MPVYQVLTDRTLAQASAITPTTLIHIVTTGDTSQDNPAGSSYKAELGQLTSLFGGSSTFTGGTVSGATTFLDDVCFDSIPSGSTGYTISVTDTGCLVIVTGETKVADLEVSGVLKADAVRSNSFSAQTMSANTVFASGIRSFSPLNINDGDEGPVYFGSTSGITIDVTNSRIGVGTTSPTKIVEIEESSTGDTRLQISNTSLSATTTVRSTLMSLTTGNRYVAMYSYGQNATGSYVGQTRSSLGVVEAGNDTDALLIHATKTNAPIVFGTQLTEKMRITGSGNIGIGNSNPTEKLTISGNTTITGNTTQTGNIILNGNIGIGTTSPSYPLDIQGSGSLFYYDPTSAGGRVVISGTTGIPRIDTLIPPYLTKPTAGSAIGMRTWDDGTYSAYGKVGDFFVRAGNAANGLNLINTPGSSTEDYIRFYAGQTPTGTADIHIQGSGSTRGYVGIGTETPSEILDVNGNTNISGNLSSNTITITTSFTPSGTTDTTGSPGSIAWDDDNFYYKTNNGWFIVTGNTF
jgi:hypothetical protein